VFPPYVPDRVQIIDLEEVLVRLLACRSVYSLDGFLSYSFVAAKSRHPFEPDDKFRRRCPIRLESGRGIAFGREDS
jgi:hypothetical protein